MKSIATAPVLTFLAVIFLLSWPVVLAEEQDHDSQDSTAICSAPEGCASPPPDDQQQYQQYPNSDYPSYQEATAALPSDAGGSSSPEMPSSAPEGREYYERRDGNYYERYEQYEGPNGERYENRYTQWYGAPGEYPEGDMRDRAGGSSPQPSELPEEERRRYAFCMQNPEECARQEGMQMPGRTFTTVTYPNHDYAGEEFARYREFREKYPEKYAGTTLCSSPEEYASWCDAHQDECGRMKEDMTGMERKEMMRTKAVGRMFTSESSERMMPLSEGVVYESYHEVAPEEMIMYKLFEGLEGSMDPSQFKQHCPDAEGMADAAFGELKAKGLFDVRRACGNLQREVERCRAESGQRCRIDDGMHCEAMDKSRMIAMCQEAIAQNPEMMQESLQGRSCEQEIDEKFDMLKENCKKSEEHMERCEEDSTKACERMEEALQRCEGMSEDRLRHVMIEKGKKMCEMMAHESTAGLADARDYVKEEYKIVLDEKAEETLDVEKKADELEKAEEEKGLGYKLKWLFGQTKEIEEAEAAQLEEQASKLDETIQALASVAADLDNEQAKTAISAQITFLEQRRDELREMAAKKHERAGGLGSMVKELFT